MPLLIEDARNWACSVAAWHDLRMAESHVFYYGDNLSIMRDLRKDSVDLIYLDPPFKSNQDYNVLFSEQDGTRAAAQINFSRAY